MTLSTVGYGDVTPVTFNEKVISLILIIIGIFVFSTITAAISSYLTDRLISSEEENEIEFMEEKFNSLENELKEIRKENKDLHEEIHDLKEIIMKKE